MSFTSLTSIKAYLRNSMWSERLTGLALMSIHNPLFFMDVKTFIKIDDSVGSEDDYSLDIPTHFTNEFPLASGVKKLGDTEHTGYKFTEDPSELVDRLRYLPVLQKCGNYTSMKDMASIIRELKDRGRGRERGCREEHQDTSDLVAVGKKTELGFDPCCHIGFQTGTRAQILPKPDIIESHKAHPANTSSKSLQILTSPLSSHCGRLIPVGASICCEVVECWLQHGVVRGSERVVCEKRALGNWSQEWGRHEGEYKYRCLSESRERLQRLAAAR
ncbi:hypothetical protein PR048_018100 [Dryococelus australis]|uniref:Uncharacterized protein n=1 Tax=Dryococelus australis TaxID=614101 RepID=A0ABQ9HBG4_9NEOP|nr:hypothetical protein PR048_018100 [Dryococelus australis]